MPDFRTGERVEVNISAGPSTGGDGTPDWQPGTVEDRLPSGFYRIRLDEAISGRTAEKEAASEHIRRPG